uniref:Uncharacterized protein n=1 Tax=Picea glauca TaxID=3330 RepID=A0A101M447_PICGL|nr:hypothetical protein ABT39_MTgene575 [Picea glauca]
MDGNDLPNLNTTTTSSLSLPTFVSAEPMVRSAYDTWRSSLAKKRAHLPFSRLALTCTKSR